MLVYWVEWRQVTVYKMTVRTWCMARTRRKHSGFISSTSSPSTGPLDTQALQHVSKQENDGGRGVQWVPSVEQVAAWKAISRSILYRLKKQKVFGIQKESTFNLFSRVWWWVSFYWYWLWTPYRSLFLVTRAWPKLCPQGLPWWSSG